MKSMYNEEWFSYLPIGNELDAETTKILRPIFDKYFKMGYSPREISQIMSSSIGMIECETLLDRNSKKVKERKKNGAPKKPLPSG